MKTAYIIRYVGMVLLLNAAFMLLSAVIGLFYGIDTGTFPLMLSFIITAAIGLFPMIYVPSKANLTSKDGYIIVIVSWIMSCLMGMLPYVVWGGEFSIVDAWFESTSGFTTTGATILNDVEALPHSLLFWRATTHWIGGVGVVLFALVVLPSVSRQRVTLSSVEISSMAKDNFRYNSRKVLSIILLVYIGLTLCETVLLNVAGMNLFDAVTHSFSTIATGGFSNKNLSIMAYDSLSIEIIIMVFMVLSGVHFGLIYSTLTGKGTPIWKSDVSRYYILAIVGGGFLVSLNLFFSGNYNDFGSSLRYGMFQAISYGSTTGFASANDAYWPPFSVLMLIVLSIQCAMAGSTSGGLKADRVLLLLKSIKQRVIKMQHPNVIRRVKLGGYAQDEQAIQMATVLVGFYLISIVVSTAFITLFDVDLITSFTSTVASMGNVGPGFGKVYSLGNMEFFNPVVKFWLSIMMLFGRLELFGLIHLFMIRSWK